MNFPKKIQGARRSERERIKTVDEARTKEPRILYWGKDRPPIN